ncbi:MAG: hypothetical protein IKJ43_02400 [Bacilli bacterium]|nr:hypothetical protein [Bacilli bacterium]
MQEDESRLEKDYLYLHPITIIDIDGELISIDKSLYVDHTPAFMELSEKINGLLYGFEKDPTVSSGYDFATFVAASGYIIIWPLDINKSDMLMISIPEIPTLEQINVLKGMYELFENREVYVTNSKFKKRSSHVPRTIPLSDSGKYEDAVKSLDDYFELIKKLNDYNNEIVGDFRDSIKHRR